MDCWLKRLRVCVSMVFLPVARCYANMFISLDQGCLERFPPFWVHCVSLRHFLGLVRLGTTEPNYYP